MESKTKTTSHIGDEDCKYTKAERCSVICRTPICKHWDEKKTETTLINAAETLFAALEKMEEYSHMHEGWQDDHPEYLEEARQAITKYKEWKNAQGV